MTWLERATSSPPVVVAHRGDCTHAPENTLAAFRAAIAAGARVIETDAQLTSDGVLFLLHDDALPRTTDSLARGIPADTVAETLTWDELAVLDAGGWFGETFRGEPLPTLASLGALLATPSAEGSTGLDLEIKPPLVHSAAEMVEAVRAELARPVWADLVAAGEIVVTSFDPEVVTLAIERLPVPVGLLTAATPTPAEVPELAASGIAMLMTEQADVTTEAIAAGRAAGLRVGVYTANAPQWERVLALGVDAICTDDPVGLRARLEDHL